jgi:uncharacterized protein
MKRLTPVTLRKRTKFVAPVAKPAYECRRCGSHEYQTGELRGAGGLISSVFELDTERFSFVACNRCRHTEFFRASLAELGQILDLLVN